MPAEPSGPGTANRQSICTAQLESHDSDAARHLALLAETAGELAGTPTEGIDDAVRTALANLGALLAADRAALFLADRGSRRLERSHEWRCCDAIPELKISPTRPDVPVEHSELCKVAVGTMPDSAFKRALQEQGTTFLVIVSLQNELGMIGIEISRNPADINEYQEQIALISARMVANAIERRESAAERQKIAHRLENAVKTGGIGTWELDLAGARFTWDETMYRIYGQSPESFSGRYQDWIELLHPDDRGWAVEESHDTKKIVPQPVRVFRILLPSGEIRHIKASASLYHDSRGRATHLIGTNMDITEQIRAEGKLKHERDILSAGPVFTIEWSNEENWPVTFVSRNVKNSLGYTPEEMQAEEFRYAELIHPDDLDRVVSEVGEHMEGGKDLFEQSYRLRCKDGQYRWFFDFTQFRRNPDTGRVTAIQGYMYEQTEHKKIEQERDLQQERLREVLEGTRAGTWQWNVQTGQTWFNEYWAEMIGYSLEELQPLSIDTWMRFAHPDDVEESGRLLQEHFRGEKPYYEFESRMRHKDGHWIWVLNRGKVSRWGDDGRPILMSGTHQDVTDRKQMEETSLQKSREMAALYDGMQDGIVIADVATKKILQCNHIIEEMTGRNRASLETLSVEALHPEDKLAETLNGFKRQSEGLQKTIESEVLHTSGKRTPVNIITSRITYNGTRCLMGIFRDISESRQARERIQSANIQLNAANQQLQASEQQLMASNQQLQASEQQLMAANQQLQASEQQLQQTGEELKEKQKLQELLTGISVRLMSTDSKQAGHAVQEALGSIGTHMRAAHITIFERTVGRNALSSTFCWHTDGEPGHHADITLDPHPRWIGESLNMKPVFIPDIASLEKKEQAELRQCFTMESRALLILPITENGQLSGIISLEWVSKPAIIDTHLPLLHIGAELLFGAINRQRWAEEITEREQQYRSIFENIQDVYTEIELNGKTITEITPSVRQFGYGREDVLHTDLMQYYRDRREITQLYLTLLRQQRIADYELHLQKKNGERCTVSFSGEVHPPEGLRPARAVGTLRDITQRKRHEAQIQENIRLKNDFISMVSHELRTPLFSILGFSSMLLKEADTPRTDTHREFLSIIHDESTRLSTLIEDVLTISRIDAGKDKYQPKPIKPDRAINDIMKTLRRSALNAKLNMTSSATAADILVMFDENALKQVLMNLVSNAIKFTPAGGSVTIHLRSDDENGIIEVEDTGMGIPEKDQEKIFDKFFRSEHSAKNTKGTGLGLAIVRDILTSLNGSVSVSSKPDRGSIFRLNIPLAEVSCSAHKLAAAP
ncbi:PAS domain-containing protein [Chlorobium sp. N1]|uniref:PAS domain-containing protein n=1 Tax=Chlorobium sp. N1 TaxID=2491138 RepID=UPI001038C6BC|nr:PAS domain-containing protein [Chlorobium sp. N1]TCD48642.1 PAS domain S-box protein [Chlorobium sp. N1]